MKKIMLASFFILASCQSTPGGNVRLSNDRPRGDCEEVGQVIGTSGTRKNAREKAMDDLRHEASLKTANYVRILAISAHGSSVRGIAYRCR